MVSIEHDPRPCDNCGDIIVEEEEPKTDHTYYIHLASGELWCNPAKPSSTVAIPMRRRDPDV